MNKNTQRERENYQIVPFSFENHTVRTVTVENESWFIAKDVCEILSLDNVSEKIRSFPSNELTSVQLMSGGQNRKMAAVNEPGLYRLVFQSRKPEAERFKTWIFNEVLPQIRKTGSYGNEGEACAGKIYRLFSACQDMTIQKMNKIIYYFALNPPLSNADIAKLLDASGSIITFWRKRLTVEMARNAVKALAINAQGIAASKAAVLPVRGDRPGFPLELPEREAQDERN
jgi:prophage antirepressor-like protein